MPSVERDGCTIAYDVQGTGPRTVLLAHNVLCNRHVFDGMVGRLRDRHRVIAVDLRGHGESSVPRRSFSTRDLAEDLRAILVREEIVKATVIGVSIGAVTAMEMALAHPERVAGLVLMGTTSESSTAIDVARNFALSRVAAVTGVRGPLLRAVIDSLFGKTFRAESPGEIAMWASRIRSMSPRAASLAVRAWAGRRALTDRLSAIVVPTLVVVGDEDVACPLSDGLRIVGALPRATLVSIPRAGHTMTVERPAETTEAVARFLASQEDL